MNPPPERFTDPMTPARTGTPNERRWRLRGSSPRGRPAGLALADAALTLIDAGWACPVGSHWVGERPVGTVAPSLIKALLPPEPVQLGRLGADAATPGQHPGQPRGGSSSHYTPLTMVLQYAY